MYVCLFSPADKSLTEDTVTFPDCLVSGPPPQADL